MKTSKIEGEYLNEREVRKSVKQRLDPNNNRNRNGKEDGLVDMILDANFNHCYKLTKERLCHWHESMFAGNLSIKTGDWRDGPMKVVTEGGDGSMGARVTRKVHYVAPDAELVDDHMAVLLDWIETEKLDPILKAGISHIWFEQIHPFDDGNGRIGRAVMDTLLARAADSDTPFHALTSQIETADDNEWYYDLMEKQGDLELNDTPLDLTEWLLWFLDCLERSMIKA